MPTYAYRCARCAAPSEEIVPFEERDAVGPCSNVIGWREASVTDKVVGAEREGWVCGGERARDFAGSAPRATRQRVWDKPRHLKASADGIRRKLDEKLASGALSPEAQHHVERGMDTGMHEYHAPQIIEP